MSRPENRYRLLEPALCAVLLLSAWPAEATGQESDTVRPVFVSARTDGGYVTITFSEEIFISPLVRYVKEWSGAPLQLFLRAAFEMSINGRVIYTQERASLSGTDLTLRMAYYAGPGDEVRVAYNNIFVRNAGGLLVDAAGNAVPYFSSQTVQNNAGSPGSNLVDGAVLTPGEITIPEGSSGTYTVKLASQPSENVTVKVMPYAIVQVMPAQMTFTPDNWDDPQTVTVSTYDDNDSVDAWAAVLHQIVGVNNANWTFINVVVDDQDPPLVVSGSTSTDYAENGASGVATYPVTNAGGATVTYRLYGDDKSDFSISRAGVLTFKRPPDYENPADSNRDNVYVVTVHASNGTSTGALLDVAINVTDVDETPAVTIAPGGGTTSVTEGTAIEFTLTRAGSATNDLTVNVRVTQAGEVIKTADSYQAPTTVAFTAGAATAPLTVETQADAVDEANGEITAEVTAGAGYTLGTAASASVAVTDDDERGVRVSETALTVPEGGSNTYTVVLTSEPTDDVTVEVSGASGDVSVSGSPLTFTVDNWDAGQTFTVDAAEDDDALADLAVTLRHTVSGGDYGPVTAEDVTVTITENDEPALSVADTSAAEGDGRMVFKVRLSQETSNEVTVSFATSNGTAQQGTDYTRKTGTLTFPARTTEQTIEVPILNDPEDEDEAETLRVTLSNPQHATLDDNQATGTIRDDDDPEVTVAFVRGSYTATEGGTAAEATVKLSADPERTVEIPLTATPQGGATASDYSLPSSVTFTSGGPTLQTFTVTATDDRVDDDGETVDLGFGSPLPDGVTAGNPATVTLDDNDDRGVTVSATTLTVSEGSSATYTVVLTSEPTGPVTVAVADASGDVSVRGSPVTLTFTADNWSTLQAVTVDAVEDDDALGDSPVTLRHTVSGGDYGSVTAEDVRVTIIENDAPTLTIESEQVAEGDGDMVFDVRLSQATSNEATVEYATSNGTAIQGTDYTAQGGTLTFPENSTIPQEIRVPILDDDVDDAIEEKTFNVTLSNALNAILAGGGTTLAVTGTIEDDDDPQVEVSFRKATYAVNEGETVEVTVRLSADPEREVTIPLTATPQNGATTADYSGVPQSVTFAAGKTSQAFNFTAINDTEDDDDERVELRFGSLPARVGVGSPAPATVAITDTNVPEVEVSFDQTRYTATEGGDAATVRVRLSADPERTVMIPLTHTPGNGAGVGDYSGVPASVTFGPSERERTLTVVATDDAEDDDGETVALGFGTLPPRITKGPSATVALTDNDETSLTPPPPRPPPPSAPDAPMVTETSTTSVTVSWEEPANDGPAITSYDLRYREGSDGAFTDGPQDVTDTSATIDGLSPDTAYEVRVRASSAAGDGEWSAVGLGRTRAPPPPAPAAPTVTETSTTSVTISWTAPTDDGPPVTSYDLRYREGSDGEFADGPQDVTDTSATIEGLSPDTAYEVQVRASSVAGDGDWSAVGTVRTNVPILNDRFSLSLDLDGSEGDQDLSFLTVSPGRVVPVQIFGADIRNTRGLSMRVGYDSTQVVFEAFDAGDMLSNAESLVERDSTFVEVGIVSPAGQATAGLVGTLRFRTTDALSETEIRLAGADVVRGEFPEVMTRSVSVALQAAAPPDPDFDGNGVVEFADFVLFAGAFGYGEGDDLPARSAQAGKYDVIYDLNGDGGIGFSDFVIFAGSFGDTVNRAPVFDPAPPVARSVAENAPAGEPIGDPVSASDADGDTLTYTLWGADAEHFDIDASTGQIRTKGTYDFEEKKGYAVIVRAGDGQGGRVSLVVSIAVTGVDE